MILVTKTLRKGGGKVRSAADHECVPNAGQTLSRGFWALLVAQQGRSTDSNRVAWERNKMGTFLVQIELGDPEGRHHETVEALVETGRLTPRFRARPCGGSAYHPIREAHSFWPIVAESNATSAAPG